MLKSIHSKLVLLGACAFAVTAATAAHAQVERAGPFMKRSEPQDWRVRVHIALTPATEVEDDSERRGPSMTEAQSDDVTVSPRFSIEQATVFWPVCNRAASYDVDRESLTGELLLSGEPVRVKATLLARTSGGQPLHSDTGYFQLTFGGIENATATAGVTFEQTVRCWNTAFDEEAAQKVAWPKGAWPVEAESTIEPMLYINSSLVPPQKASRVSDLVKRYTGNNPKRQPPVVVAKWIAGELAKTFRVTGDTTVADFVPGTPRQSAQSVGAIGGLNVIGAVDASQNLRGSPIDLALLLTACYRQAGLPARVVIGSVVESENTIGEAFRGADRPEPGLYAWVEFALYDETQTNPNDALTWVPVDIIAMRAGNVGRRPFDQPWPGFGTSEMLKDIVPLAYHLHPHQVGALSYGITPRRVPIPSLWGWNVAPEMPLAVRQAITISVTSPSKSGEPTQRRRGE